MSEPEVTTEDVQEAVETTEAPPGYSPYKLGIGVSVVMVLASISLFLAFLTLWADRQILDSQQWTDTSTEVIEEPVVRNALATYLVDQLFDEINVEQELKNQLPNDWDVLASPATSAMHSLALSAAKQALAQPAVQAAWKQANLLTHEQLIAILEGGNDKVSTENGVVTINGKLILSDVARQVGLSQSLVDKIPAGAGNFEVWRSNDLAAAQNAYKISKDLRWVFAGLAALLFIVAIWLAAGRRRRAVTWMGVSFISVGLLVLIAVSLAKTPAVNGLAQTASVKPAVAEIYTTVTELLKTMARSIIFTGVLVVLAALVAGPYRWAVATRRFLAPYFRDYLPVSIAAALLLYLIIIWLVPATGFRQTTGLIINSILAIAGFIALVRISRQEFPDAEPVDFGGVGSWMGDRWTSARGYVEDKTRDVEMPKFGRGEETTKVTKVEERTVETDTAGAPTTEQPTDKIGELERLAQLHRSGALNDAEFEAAKKNLLG